MKTERKLKVYRSTQSRCASYHHTQYIDVPMILLKGQWLSAAGFSPDDKILVTIQDNIITITKE